MLNWPSSTDLINKNSFTAIVPFRQFFVVIYWLHFPWKADVIWMGLLILRFTIEFPPSNNYILKYKRNVLIKWALEAEH